MALFSRFHSLEDIAVAANQSTVDDLKSWIVEGDGFRDWLAKRRQAREPQRPLAAQPCRPPTLAEAHASIRYYALAMAELELAKTGKSDLGAAIVRREAIHFLNGIILELVAEQRSTE